MCDSTDCGTVLNHTTALTAACCSHCVTTYATQVDADQMRVRIATMGLEPADVDLVLADHQTATVAAIQTRAASRQRRRAAASAAAVIVDLSSTMPHAEALRDDIVAHAQTLLSADNLRGALEIASNFL